MNCFRRFRQENRGLTLVELIVALAIFAIAGLTIYGFVSFASKNFSESNKNVKLQYEQQIVVNRIKDIILETSHGISYNTTDHRMLSFSDPESGPSSTEMRVSLIKWDNTTNELIYGFQDPYPIKKEDGKNITLPEITHFSKDDVLASDVSDFSVDLSKVESGKVTFTITFKVGEKEVTVSPVVSLRNNINKYDDDIDLEEMYSEVEIPIYSHIAKVEISRDGKIFAQNKMDTIKMAGNSTSAVYAAIVTAKKGYESSISTECTWQLDPATVKSGYEECIVVSSGGTSNGNSLCTVTFKNSGAKKPEDYMVSGYITIIATSMEDSSRSARVRIKASSDGVYPVSINVHGNDSYDADSEHGLAKYKLTHDIQYTGPVEYPEGSGTMVNPLTDPGSYDRISYKILNISGPSLSSIPDGAGFINSSAVDGVFYATKSMEEHTITIRVSVNQRNKDGEEVYKDFDISVPKGAIPDIVESTKPALRCEENALRAGTLDMAADWTEGVPEYTEGGRKKQYYYWFEWEIDNFENACQNWGSGDNVKNSFDNVYFISLDDTSAVYGNVPNSLGKTFSSDQTKRYATVYTKKTLDWEKSFTFRVKLRVILSKTNSKGNTYFKLPTADAPDDILGTKDQAYTASAIVTIDPVTLKLSPAYMIENGKYTPVVMYKENGGEEGDPLEAVFNDLYTVGLGKNYNSRYNGYYKIYIPEFEGIYVTRLNYQGLGCKLADKLYSPNGTSCLISYYHNTTGADSSVEESMYDVYNMGIRDRFKKKDRNNQMMISYRLCFYLQLIPYKWVDKNRFPNYCVWTCQFADTETIKDDSNKDVYRNYVNATVYEYEKKSNGELQLYEIDDDGNYVPSDDITKGKPRLKDQSVNTQFETQEGIYEDDRH